MQRGRHARRRFGGRRWPVVLVVVGVLAAVGGSAYAAYRYDLATTGRIMPGITVAGVDVGDMTRAEAVAAVAEAVRPRLESTVDVRAADATWSATAQELGLRASIGDAVERALAADDSMSFFARVFDRLADRPLDEVIDVEFRLRPSPLRQLVGRIAEEVAVAPRDAAIFLDGEAVVMRKPKEGRALRLDGAVQRLQEAVVADGSAVKLPTRPVKPDVGVVDLGYTLVVDRAANELSVYKGFRLESTFRIATGTPEYETPAGTWTIIDKQVNPTWVNPAPDGWGSSLPAVIPGGPGSPLGTRALYLDAPGIRIHGTYDVDSIGTAASHGCIRMLIEDVEELYEYIPTGTTVLVL